MLSRENIIKQIAKTLQEREVVVEMVLSVYDELIKKDAMAEILKRMNEVEPERPRGLITNREKYGLGLGESAHDYVKYPIDFGAHREDREEDEPSRPKAL